MTKYKTIAEVSSKAYRLLGKTMLWLFRGERCDSKVSGECFAVS